MEERESKSRRVRDRETRRALQAPVAGPPGPPVAGPPGPGRRALQAPGQLGCHVSVTLADWPIAILSIRISLAASSLTSALFLSLRSMPNSASSPAGSVTV